MISRRFGVLLGLVLLTVVAGCGIPVDDSARPLSADEIPPTRPKQESPPVSGVDPAAAAVDVYFVRGSQVVAVHRNISVPPSVEGALGAMVRGPSSDERRDEIRTALTSEVRLEGTVAVGVPLIEVTDSFSEIELDEQILALAQLVFTLTGLPGVEGVSFALSGRPVEVPTGDGTLKQGPLRREDYGPVAPT